MEPLAQHTEERDEAVMFASTLPLPAENLSSHKPFVLQSFSSDKNFSEQVTVKSLIHTNEDEKIEDKKVEVLPYDSPTQVEQLLHKIAQLEMQLQEPNGVSLSSHHRNRMLGKVLESEMRSFLNEAHQTPLCQKCLAEISPVGQDQPGIGAKRCREQGMEPQEIGKKKKKDPQKEFSHCLNVIRVEKSEVEDKLRTIREKTIVPLEKEVESLQKEKRKIQQEYAQLLKEHQALLEKTKEDFYSSECRPNGIYSSVIEELHQLRESEALLRGRLEEMHLSTLATTEKMVELMKPDEETTVARNSELQECMLLQMEKLRESERSRHIVVLSLEEEKERHRREVEILAAQQQQWGGYYLKALQEWEDRFGKAKLCITEQEDKNSQLQERLEKMQESMKTTEVEATTEQEKRRRFESIECNNGEETVSQSKSLRVKCLLFWEEGHKKIAEQEQKLKAFEQRCAALRLSEQKIRQLERQQHFEAQQLVTLASTVEQLRKSERALKAELAGVQIERDCLIGTLGKAFLRGNAEIMSQEELEKCSYEVRQAARVAAAASAAVVADPKVMEEAARRAHACKTEVERLEKQKEKLLRFIHLRQKRIASLLAQEAVGVMGSRFPSSHSSPGEKSDALASSNVSLMQILEHARQCARDIFNECEQSVLGPEQRVPQNTSSNFPPLLPLGHSAETHSFLAQRQQLDALLHERTAMQATCESLQKERSILNNTLQKKRDELAHNAITSDKVINALQTSNHKLIIQQAEFRRQILLQNKRNQQMENVVRNSVRGMSCIFELLKAEISSSVRQRNMISSERATLRDVILRFQNGDSNDYNKASSQLLHSEENEIVNAITSLGTTVQNAVSCLHMECSSNHTSFLSEVVRALRAQEDRLSELQKVYEDNVGKLAQQLSERIESAHGQWDTSWQEKYESMEAFQRHFLVKEKGYAGLLQKIEEVPFIPPASATASSPSASTLFAQEAIERGIRSIQSYMNPTPLREQNDVTEMSSTKSDEGQEVLSQLAEKDKNASIDTLP